MGLERGPAAGEPTFGIARSVYLRCLGLGLVVAFVALWLQAPGLIGPRGITPLADIMAELRERGGHGAAAAFWQAPSLFWLTSAPWFVRAVIVAGGVAGGLLAVGVFPRACCLVGYVAWLSFRAIEPGMVRWFNYPFDDLQTELLVLGFFVAPANALLWRADARLPRWARWLVVWFAFRLLFGPGLAKVLYHEPWRDLSAVSDFLLTMPHPTPWAAWFHDLGAPWLQALTAFTLVCEVVLPWLFFVPGWPRRIAAAVCLGLMVGIQLVCNIRGFQPLTAALLLLLWDDGALRRVFGRMRCWLGRRSGAGAVQPGFDLAVDRRPDAERERGGLIPRWGVGVAALVYFAASLGPCFIPMRLELADHWPAGARVANALQPLRLSSCYTMFCLMPQERFVLVVQGSADGSDWRDYELLGPPAAVDRAPIFFAPYHDYLGFRLWFAGFCPPSEDAWLGALQQRLLAGEPAVERLFWSRPFEAPPRWVRIAWYRYEYASAEGRATGAHWRREWLGVRVPARSRPE